MKSSLIIISLLFFGCKIKDEDLRPYQAQLTCYAGEKVFYQITTDPYKIHNPIPGESTDRWEIDTDQGKVIITGTCIYKTAQ